MPKNIKPFPDQIPSAPQILKDPMRFFLLLLLVFAVSCSSAKKKAIELSEKERHEEAIEFWVKALKDDPKDEEVREGFQRSLEFVSNARLIKIRDRRLSNNHADALEELKHLVNLQLKYDFKLDFNSSTFQGKEVRALWPVYRARVENKLKNQRPLSAESDQLDFKAVFSSMPDYLPLAAEVKKHGQKKCMKIKGLGTKEPFYQSFVSQYCKYFAQDRTISSVAISSVLYNDIDLKAQIKNLNETSLAPILTNLRQALTETPWYNQEGHNKITLNLTGDYQWKTSKEMIKQAHNYQVKIPYTDYKSVKKSRQVPYNSFENGQTVTKYRTEYYNEQEPVTKYRKEARVYHYLAHKKTLNLDLNLKGISHIGKHSYPFAFHKNEKEERILHDMNLPDIGLTPSTQDTANPLSKLDLYAAEMSQNYKNELNKIWEKNYCTLPQGREMASIGENTLRCMRLTNYPATFVDSWFKTHFGVTGARAKEILGVF